MNVERQAALQSQDVWCLNYLPDIQHSANHVIITLISTTKASSYWKEHSSPFWNHPNPKKLILITYTSKGRFTIQATNAQNNSRAPDYTCWRVHQEVIQHSSYLWCDYAGRLWRRRPGRFLWFQSFLINHQPASLLCQASKTGEITGGHLSCSERLGPSQARGSLLTRRGPRGLSSLGGTCQRHFFLAPLTGQLRASRTAENLRLGAAVRSTTII